MYEKALNRLIILIGKGYHHLVHPDLRIGCRSSDSIRRACRGPGDGEGCFICLGSAFSNNRGHVFAVVAGAIEYNGCNLRVGRKHESGILVNLEYVGGCNGSGSAVILVVADLDASTVAEKPAPQVPSVSALKEPLTSSLPTEGLAAVSVAE